MRAAAVSVAAAELGETKLEEAKRWCCWGGGSEDGRSDLDVTADIPDPDTALSLPWSGPGELELPELGRSGSMLGLRRRRRPVSRAGVGWGSAGAGAEVGSWKEKGGRMLRRRRGEGGLGVALRGEVGEFEVGERNGACRRAGRDRRAEPPACTGGWPAGRERVERAE